MRGCFFFPQHETIPPGTDMLKDDTIIKGELSQEEKGENKKKKNCRINGRTGDI